VKTIFFDVDTQIDFVFPAGALAVPDAASLTHNFSALTRFALANGVKIFSTADAHSENDPEFKLWKPHCVVGTVGQQKIPATTLNNRLVLTTARAALEGIKDRIVQAPQIVIEKQKIDCFTNSNLPPLLDLLHADRYVVYGVVSEVCVQCTAFGLLRTGASVELVTDAIKSLDAAAEQEMLARFQAQGGILTTVASVTA
jgi:nicotinamidase/pyrazinamidase